ncbi:MAG TPA: glucodextranase DOMON-like domain-containing protein [Halanaerobiales bacterium]|nr:glucodextranase DOMON-like domain-containing protein [Halanaerobiales bacterium]
MKITRTVFLLLFFLFFLGMNISAEDYQNIISINDPEGDDYGPGTYLYPADDIFKVSEGLFDIVSFSVKESEELYLFEFEFGTLTDPWAGKYGFSLPFIELYIDNQKGGSTSLYREGAGVRLDQKHPWNVLIVLCGWWVRAYTPDDRGVELDFWETDENPWDIESAEVVVDDKVISLSFDKEVTGDLNGAYLYLLVGGYDPFGPGYYRGVGSEISRWNFADLSNRDLRYAPRVIDLILPSNRKQEDVLSDFSDDYPIIYPVRLGTGGFLQIIRDYSIYILISLFIIFLLILLVYIMHKRPLISHNNR